MYAAGYLEAALTSQLIFDHYTNMFIKFNFTNASMQAAVSFFERQNGYARENINNPSGNIAFWQRLGLIMAQFDGLFAGYNQFAALDTQLTLFDIYFLNGMGDFEDIPLASLPSLRPDFKSMSASDADAFLGSRSHCTAVVKLTPDYSHLYMAHSSWFTFESMNRIMKNCMYRQECLDRHACLLCLSCLHTDNFAVSSGNETQSFSSYPGMLSSWDDYYILGSTMVMLQTTNPIFNTSLYDLIVPETILV